MASEYNISLDTIKKVVQESKHPDPSEKGSFKPASVIALVSCDKEPNLLFIKKAENEKYAWSGQMAFPGGHSDPEDNNRQETALRELNEEMGISENNVELLGSIGHFSTINNREIETFIGIWNRKEEIVFDEAEISRVMNIPLGTLIDLHIEKGFDKERPNIFSLTYPFEDVVIWGVTAKMIYHLVDILLPEIKNSVFV